MSDGVYDNIPTDPIIGQPTSKESSLSDWAGGYVTDMLGKGQALANMPYEAYGGPLTAGSSDLQTQAFSGLANLTVPTGTQPLPGFNQNTTTTAASNPFTTGTNTFGANQTGTNAFNANQFDTNTFGANQFDTRNTGTNTFGAQQFGTNNVGNRSFTDQGVAGQYMNPYLQQALDPQLREASKQASMSRMADAARLSQAGAFGGSRQAIMESEGSRNMLNNMADITGQGYSQAYQQASSLFGQEEGARREQANLNEQRRLGQLNTDEARRLQQLESGENRRLNQFNTGEDRRLGQLNTDEGRRLQQLESGENRRLGQLNTDEGRRLDQLNTNEARRLGQFNTGEDRRLGQLESGENRRLNQFNTGENRRLDQFNTDEDRRLGQFNTGEDARRSQFNIETDRNLRNIQDDRRYGLDAINTQLGAGATQRGIEQEGVAADMAQYEAERMNPYQNIQFMQSLLQGLPIATNQMGYAGQSDLQNTSEGAAWLMDFLSKMQGGSNGGGGNA